MINLARALGAQLQAVLLEDVAALALAELPSPRAFDPRVSLWRDVQRAELQREFEAAAAALRRRFEAAQDAGLQAQVTIVRGGAPSVLGEPVAATDLLVITEPAEPMARFVQPFVGLVGAALASSAAVLYLPHRGARGSGPIVAIGQEMAAELAQGLAEALGAPFLKTETGQSSTKVRSLHALLPQLQAQRVRVVVCGRAALGAQPQRVLQEAGDRRLAVLLAPAAEGT
jgi:hypothetical protein